MSLRAARSESHMLRKESSSCVDQGQIMRSTSGRNEGGGAGMKGEGLAEAHTCACASARVCVQRAF
eukprot:6178018-Pleurochrysis_carterae.AAC.1